MAQSGESEIWSPTRLLVGVDRPGHPGPDPVGTNALTIVDLIPAVSYEIFVRVNLEGSGSVVRSLVTSNANQQTNQETTTGGASVRMGYAQTAYANNQAFGVRYPCT